MNTALGPTSQDTMQKVKYVQVDLSIFFYINLTVYCQNDVITALLCIYRNSGGL